MKRFSLITTVLALLLVTLAIQSARAQSTLRRTLDDLEVDIWTDKDDGTNYYEGDDIWIYFRASQDAYVVVYDLDTRGNINLIFPEVPTDNHYVEAGEVYMIPNRYAEYALTLEGPPGDEHLQVIASREFFPVPEWRDPINVHNQDFWGFEYEGDNQEFISKINFKYFPQRSAYDQIAFYVAPSHYYEPVESDCYGDCGQVYIDYPNGCEVYVDGVFYGYAPLYVPSAYVGRHRVTVYWGASIVYNDWIVLSRWDPYFIYPRPIWVYDYYWTHWYRDYHWGYYDYYGWDHHRYPSDTKYKYGDNFYSYSKPEPKRGYKVVANSHRKYTKSNTYTAAKTTRITKIKTDYGYNKTTKTFTKSNPYGQGKSGYNAGTAKRGSPGAIGGKATVPNSAGNKSYNSKNRGTYTPGSTGKSGGSSKGTVKPRSGGKSGGSSKGTVKPRSGGNSGGRSGGGAKSSGGGSKAGGGSSKGAAKSGGSKPSSGKATTGGTGKVGSSGSKSSGSSSGSVKKSAPGRSGASKSGSSGKSGGSNSSSKSKGKSKK